MEEEEVLGVPTEEHSRAGRKRKANAKYLDEPSPISKPPAAKKALRRASEPSRKPVTVVDTVEAPPVVGPPTFGALLFGKDTRSVDSWDDEPIDDQPIEEQDEPAEEEPILQVEPGQRMSGTYVPTGVAGFAKFGAPILSAPNCDWIQFPNMATEEIVQRGVHVMSELGGGILGLLPQGRIFWLRDEVPKLSAYFKKKLDSSSGTKKVEPKQIVALKRVSSSVKAEMEAKRREREMEQKRILEERQKRKERERLKLLYRQHWIALTKFPIEDSVLHSAKGIRRLGGSRPIAGPTVYWNTLISNEPGGECSADLADSVLVTWTFCSTFGWLFKQRMAPFSFPQLFEAFLTRSPSALIGDLHWSLIDLMRPWLESQLTALLQAEQVWEAQLVRNRARAKIYWPTFSQFRDFVHLGNALFVLNPTLVTPGNWPWLFLYLVKAIILFEAIDVKREFLASVAASFEEFDFQYKFVAQWERSFLYETTPIFVRVKSIKTVIDKILSLGLLKKTVDVFCDAKLHISSEIALLEKEERKGNQKIALSQKLIAIVEEAKETTSIDLSSIQIPLSPEELKAEIALRDSMHLGKKIASSFADKWLGVRLEPLGRDRHSNEYFQVSFNKRIVFVRCLAKEEANVSYGIYDSLGSLECLIQSLDERGVKEFALKSELQNIKANLYSELLLENEPDLANKTSCDWLAPYTQEPKEEPSIGQDLPDVPSLHSLQKCVLTASKSLAMIRACWYGEKYSKLKALVPRKAVGRPPKQSAAESLNDDDDMTVDEGMEDEEEEPVEEPVEVEDEFLEILPILKNPLVTEQEYLFQAISFLSQVLSTCLAEGFIAKQTLSVSSVLVEFHVKSGNDFLRHAGVPTSLAEVQKMLSILAVPLLDGLLAIDEVILDEIARHGQFVGLDIDVWPTSGGEKAAWKLFLGRPNVPEDEEEEGAFPCETCGKQFRLHILLGLHKLKPCKTRGRKPIAAEPQMEARPSNVGGPSAIETLVLPQFPPPPSSRQVTDSAVPELSGSYVCEICGKIFPQNQGLAVHQTRWCIPEQQAQLILTAQQAAGGQTGLIGAIPCETCGKLYPTAQGLAIHQSRWCKKSSDEPILTHLEHRTISKSVAADLNLLLDMEEEESTSYEQTEPGYTPACYSISAIAMATRWLGIRIEGALDKFKKVHHTEALQTSGNKKK